MALVVTPVEPAPLPITVIIPAYNRAHTVARAVRSALRQRPRPPAQVLVIDDGSTDETAAVAERAGAEVVRQGVNQGLGAARNSGLDHAAEPWIALLDSDDEWLPHHLGSLWPQRADHVFLAGSALRCSPGGEQHHLGPAEAGGRRLRSPVDVATTSIVVVSAVVARRDAIEAVGRFREFEGPMHGVEDVDLWLRLLERGTGFVSSRVSAIYHEHAGQMTADGNKLQVARRAVLESCADRPWFDPSLLTEWDGVMAWDAARTAQRSRELRAAFGHLAWVAGRPRAAGAVLRELRARRGGRRRSWQLTPSGRSPGWPRPSRRASRPRATRSWFRADGRSSAGTRGSRGGPQPPQWWTAGPSACSYERSECRRSRDPWFRRSRRAR
jgi:hypothetical protein